MPAPPYAPRHAAVPADVPTAAAATSQSDEIKAPGIAAMLHRSPRQVRYAAIGTLGLGVALFVATSVAAAATSHPRRSAPPAAHAAIAAVPAQPVPAAAAPTAAGPKVAAAQPLSAVKPGRQAPATKQVISGLAANGIPNVALNAYRVAAARMKSAQPSCGIDWALLAGIGREESDHGQFHGAVLHPDGTSTPRIIGPALDGTHGQYIPAPLDGYALDGDRVYTHALGPMQFIPQTWARYGVDANGDGKKDVFNINDAALGAARYLCAAGGNLRSVAGQIRAVRAYNHDDTYVAQVLALAAAYRAGVPVTGLPVGQLTGALPPLLSGGTLGVDPGVPTAIGGSHGVLGRLGSGSAGTSRTSPSSPTGTGSHRPTQPPARSSSAPSQPHPGTSSSTPPSSGSSTPPSSGKSSSSPAPKPTPSPTPTCRLGVGGVCVVP